MSIILVKITPPLIVSLVYDKHVVIMYVKSVNWRSVLSKKDFEIDTLWEWYDTDNND